ncbi:MAG TPA: monovalent cation/H(+) antiporter subunit G [Bacteroidota bacterium]|nr:monovalent cation/H(+) antiporter subunit G [Bacteroidota bacterium]
MTQVVVAILLVLGALFYLISAVGTLRFPDLYIRMHAATKASAFASGLMLFGVILHFAEVAVTLEALLIIAFVFLTAPIAGHMIGRAAYYLATPLWDGTIIDELKHRPDLLRREQSDRSDHAQRIEDADNEPR